MKKYLGYLSLALLTACNGVTESLDTAPPSNGGTATNPLANSDWVLTAYTEATGVKTEPTQYVTLHFDTAGQVSGQFDCGAYAGSYSMADTLITITNAKPANTNCTMAPADANYMTLLNAITTKTADAQQLTLGLGDGRKLGFAKKFTGCKNPRPVTGNASTPIQLTINTTVNDAEGLIAKFEKNNPDFILQPSQACGDIVKARVNPDTLEQLRCDPVVSSLTYN